MSNQKQINIRRKVLQMVVSSREGHVASSFSIIEILTAIYQYLDDQGKSQDFASHFILSKGHGVYALYAMMSELGFIPDEELAQVCQYDSYLIGHVPVKPDRGFYVGTGSLGQGLPMALGRAYDRRRRGDTTPEFVIVGDGEFNEGSIWETLMFMQKFPKCKLRVFVDNNKSSTRAIPMSRVFDAVSAGWNTVEVDGHDIQELITVLNENDTDDNLIILCNTQKGYPLQAMNNPMWHHRMPTPEEANEFILEIEQFFEPRTDK
jgi:transketolase